MEFAVLNQKDIDALGKAMDSTRFSGEKVSESTFGVLKNFLTEQLIECIGSSDPRLRRAAVRVSTRFSSLPKDHQNRVIYAMSSKVKL